MTEQKSKILLIEDDVAFGESLMDIMMLHNLDVVLTKSAEEATEIIENSRFDLIISDIGLPGKSGYDMLSSVRENLKTYQIPFIFLSAYNYPEDQRKGMNLGADDYLTKPVDIADLIQAIDAKIKHSRSNRQLMQNEMVQKAISMVEGKHGDSMLKPLQSIINACFVIETYPHDISGRDIRDLNREIYKSANRSLRNTRNLMLFNMLNNAQTPRLNNFAGDVFISDVVEQILLYYNNGIVTNGTISSDSIEMIPVKYSNQTLFLILFSEIIDNAVRYNSGICTPYVSLKSTDDEGFVFTVTNAAPLSFHFATEDILPFNTIRNEHDNSGLGLGLYLCKTLSELLLINFNAECTDGLFSATITK